MIEIVLGMVMALVLGCVMGVFYFSGLWWTVQRLAKSRYPGLFALGSFGFRLAVIMLGFLLAAKGGHWERLLSALLGVILVRFLLLARARLRREAEGA